MFESEIFFYCPYCGEKISMILESLYGGQTYIEDCEVCCRPIEVNYKAQNNEIISLDVKRLD
jgi:hypothetical protein